VPKLELSGAELLSRLIAEVTGTSAFQGKMFSCWGDSAVARMNDRINRNASDGGVELRKGTISS